MSVAKRLLKEKEQEGSVVAYIRESGFVVYSTPTELEKRDVGGAALVAAALEEIAANAPVEPVIDEDMEAALAAASSAGTMVKPSRLAYKRRELGEKKERKEAMPEVVIEPLAKPPSPEPEEVEEPKPKKKTTKKVEEEKPKKKKAKDKVEEAKPKKKATKKVEEEKPKKKKAKDKVEEAKPQKKATKEKSPKPDKKAETKKTTTKKEEPKTKDTKKETTKKPTLSDIDGVGPKTVESLSAAGYKTVASLAKADPSKLSEKVDGIGATSASQIVGAAQKLLPEETKSKTKKTK